MTPSLKKAQNGILTSIGALQTVLERYPNLLTNDQDAGNNAAEFILTLLRQFGITEEKILGFIAELLAGDPSNGVQTFLDSLDIAVRAAILLSFKETYTCSVDPTLPDNIMYNPHWDDHTDYMGVPGVDKNGGVEIVISDVDPFGLLDYCPTSRDGSIFYFDTSPYSGYTPMNVYTSTDFHAFLWFCINKGMFDVSAEERKKLTWDNRGWFYKKWAKDGCLNGNMEGDKGVFFNEDCDDCGVKFIPEIKNVKTEILVCKFEEANSFQDASSMFDVKTNNNKIRVFANYDRYYRTGLNGQNKTIFEFNADYLGSMKLFDPKTMVAQIMNAVLGLAYEITSSFSVEKSVISKKIKNIVKNVINDTTTETTDISDCYYTFSNDEYNALMNEAMANYDGVYHSGNKNIEVPTDNIIDELYKIEDADSLEEQITTITRIFNTVSETLSESDEVEDNDKKPFKIGIIDEFINETIVELVMQILSPKVMILFAINEKIMNPGSNSTNSALNFMKKFWNLLLELIKRISDIIIKQLFEFLMQQIRPLITLFVQKLLLETIMYYKMLIEDLIKSCMFIPEFNFDRTGVNELIIQDVRGADIIVPEQTEPKEEGGC